MAVILLVLGAGFIPGTALADQGNLPACTAGARRAAQTLDCAVPAGVHSIQLVVIAAGGGGGGGGRALSNNTSGFGGGGGAGGASGSMASCTLDSISADTDLHIVVPAGGPAGTGAASTGTDGGVRGAEVDAAVNAGKPYFTAAAYDVFGFGGGGSAATADHPGGLSRGGQPDLNGSTCATEPDGTPVDTIETLGNLGQNGKPGDRAGNGGAGGKGGPALTHGPDGCAGAGQGGDGGAGGTAVASTTGQNGQPGAAGCVYLTFS